MPIEQRVVSGQKIGGKIGGGSAAPAVEEETEDAPKKSRKKLVLVAVPVLLAVLGAVYFFVLAPKSGAPAAEPTPEPGEVLAVDPVSLNLADGHYLRLGFSLQLTKDTAEAPDPSKAVDAAITLFSGRTVAEVSDAKTREKLRATLTKTLAEDYEGEVMGVYLTNYVTQ